MNEEEYSAYIEEWDSLRLQRLKAPDGWVNLAGLFWLKEGENSLGSSGRQDIVFPRGPAEIGIMTLTGNQVIFSPSGDINLKADGEDVLRSIKIFGDNMEAKLLTVDSLGFFIIKRGDRTGIRLRDYVHPRLEALKNIDRYEPDQDWIIQAKFIESENDMVVMVPDVLGDVSEHNVPGILEFNYEGELRKVYPTGSGDRLFLIYADETNALETYGSGRFLNIDGPDRAGYVYIDFNKAYNPPCAFSPFATCPLPPKENFLPFRVVAGEKKPEY